MNQNTTLDVCAALASNVPYVGGPLSFAFNLAKKAEDVITWDQIKDYVDEAIDKKLLEADVNRTNNEVSILFSNLNDYQTRIAGNYNPSTEWIKLVNLNSDAFNITKYVLGRRGFKDDFIDYEGIWERSPYPVVSTVGKLIAINIAVLLEMIAMLDVLKERNLSTPEQLAADRETIINDINFILGAFVESCGSDVPDSFFDRRSSLVLSKDKVVHETYIDNYTYKDKYTYYLYWHDDYDSSVGESYKKVLNHPSGSEKNKQQKKCSEKRNVYLNHVNSVQKEAGEHIFNNVLGPLDQVLSLAPSFNKEITDLRKEMGMAWRLLNLNVAYNNVVYDIFCALSRHYVYAKLEGNDTWLTSIGGYFTIDSSSSTGYKFHLYVIEGTWKSGDYVKSTQSNAVSWSASKAQSGKLSNKLGGLTVKWKMPNLPEPVDLSPLEPKGANFDLSGVSTLSLAGVPQGLDASLLKMGNEFTKGTKRNKISEAEAKKLIQSAKDETGKLSEVRIRTLGYLLATKGFTPGAIEQVLVAMLKG